MTCANETKPATDGENAIFSMKILEATDELAFNLEAQALMKIRRNQHLATAVTAFKYQNQYHLLFNWAEGGNLLDFWMGQAPSLTHHSMCWLAQQCCGLAEGLSGIHDASMHKSELAVPADLKRSNLAKNDDRDYGRHGDIKPQNILWFRQEDNSHGYGVLKISDFGVTMFHSELTTQVLPDNVRSITQSYAAPEIELGNPVSRPYDIWSLGCIFIEFITWALLGFKGVQDFRANRKADRDIRINFALDDFYGVYRSRFKIRKWSRRDFVRVKPSVTDVSWRLSL